jgi:hypothetical protein
MEYSYHRLLIPSTNTYSGIRNFSLLIRVYFFLFMYFTLRCYYYYNSIVCIQESNSLRTTVGVYFVFKVFIIKDVSSFNFHMMVHVVFFFFIY